MKILIVHAHENPNSFCSSLAQQTQNIFQELGHEVAFSDLYQMSFNPVGGKDDFIALSDNDYYKYASEQLHSSASGGFEKTLSAEMTKLIEADVLNFNFPLWWFGMPAILKGWVDRVMAYGVAYGGEFGFKEQGRFKDRTAFLTVSTGSPQNFYTKEGAHQRSIADILRNIDQGIFKLVGYNTLDPFVGFAVSRISHEERVQILENYTDYLKRNFS